MKDNPSTPVVALELVGVSRSYGQGHVRLDVFADASLALGSGELVAPNFGLR